MEIGKGKSKDQAPPKHDAWEGLREALDVPLQELRAALSQTKGAVVLQGAEVRSVPATTTGRRISTSAGRLMGWALRETAGAPATVYLRDGRDAGGEIVVPLQLAANESTRDYFAGGLSLVDSLYLDVVAGSVEGAVFVGGAD